MELVQRQPLRRRIEQVREREADPGAFRAEVLAREPVDRQRAERDRDGLDDEQKVRARPGKPERREGDEDRVEVRGEAGDFVSTQARDGERVAVRGRPDRLDHVAKVEAAGLERAVAQDRERREGGRVGGDPAPEEEAWGREPAGCH